MDKVDEMLNASVDNVLLLREELVFDLLREKEGMKGGLFGGLEGIKGRGNWRCPKGIGRKAV